MKKTLPTLLGWLSRISPPLAARIAFRMFATPVRIPRPASEQQWHEQAKKYYLKSGIAAFEWGESHHPLVLLIHGWNGRGTQLASFAASLVDKGFRVVALDGPGHGISPGKMTNPSHYAKFIQESQQELNPEGAEAVIAHSFGGGCSVLAASRGLKVQKLVLVASPNFYDRVVQYYADNFRLNQKTQERFFQIVTKVAGLHPKDLNVGKIGSTLAIKAMIVHDEQDNAVSVESAKWMHQSWPGSILMITQGLGHRRILKDKQVIEAVTNFISSKD